VCFPWYWNALEIEVSGNDAFMSAEEHKQFLFLIKVEILNSVQMLNRSYVYRGLIKSHITRHALLDTFIFGLTFHT